MTSVPASELPTSAFAFQVRRFACDRCHRFKLKCERGPLLMTSDYATPFGPCKRCEKAGVDCTSNNATTSTPSKRKANKANDGSSENSQTIPHKAPSPTIASIPSRISTELEGASHPAMPLFNNFETDFADSVQFMDTFGLDQGAMSGESLDPFDPSLVARQSLPSPSQSRASGLSKEIRTAEQAQFSVDEIAGGNVRGMSEFLDMPSWEGFTWNNDDSLSAAAVDAPTPLSAADAFTATLKLLSDLQTFIFLEFGNMTRDDLAKTLLSPSSDAYHRGHGAKDGNVIGKTVYASERLIDILTSCGRHEAEIPSSPASFRYDDKQGTKRSRSSLYGDEGLPNRTMSSPVSSRFRGRTVDTQTPHLDYLRKTNVNTSSAQSIFTASGSNKSDAPIYSGLLSPAKLTLLVCYVSLLGVYRSVLTLAFETFGSSLPPSPPSRSRTPRGDHFSVSMAALQPRTPHIDSSKILGFRMQLEMLMHTLEQIDDAWAAAFRRGTELGGERHRDGVMATTVLLQSMLTHEGFEFDDETDTLGLGSLMVQMESLKTLLRSHSAASRA